MSARGVAPLRSGCRDVAAGAGAVWALANDRPLLMRIDPTTGGEVARIPLPRPGSRVAAGASGVWVGFGWAGDSGPGAVGRLEPATEAMGPALSFRDGRRASPSTRAVPGWPQGRKPAAVRVPADGGATGAPIDVRREPVGIARVAGSVLVVSDAGVVTRIDPATDRADGLPTVVGGRPHAVARRRRALGVLAEGCDAAARPGGLRAHLPSAQASARISMTASVERPVASASSSTPFPAS